MPILPTRIMELIVIKIGLYDTWVARDVCGTPLRPFWPFVKDQATMSRVRDQKPFEVSSCWNGAVVFPAKPYIYSPPTPPTPPTTTNLRRRGWKMIDNCSPPPPPPPPFRTTSGVLLMNSSASYPDFRESPALNFPIQFRSSGIDACDHSECFLFSYDLHRLYPTRERPPRIYMNPSVKVAYQENWYRWHNHVLRIPIVKWWLGKSPPSSSSTCIPNRLSYSPSDIPNRLHLLLRVKLFQTLTVT